MSREIIIYFYNNIHGKQKDDCDEDYNIYYKKCCNLLCNFFVKERGIEYYYDKYDKHIHERNEDNDYMIHYRKLLVLMISYLLNSSEKISEGDTSPGTKINEGLINLDKKLQYIIKSISDIAI